MKMRYSSDEESEKKIKSPDDSSDNDNSIDQKELIKQLMNHTKMNARQNSQGQYVALQPHIHEAKGIKNTASMGLASMDKTAQLYHAYPLFTQQQNTNVTVEYQQYEPSRRSRQGMSKTQESICSMNGTGSNNQSGRNSPSPL